jgi:hypothetical protein
MIFLKKVFFKRQNFGVAEKRLDQKIDPISPLGGGTIGTYFRAMHGP